MRYVWKGGFHPAVHAPASQDLDLPPSSLGMSEEARDLLDSIRSLAGQGLTPGQIAAQLRLIEDGVRNVLAMGRHAYNPGAEAPAHTPEINAYRNGFARRSW